MNHDRRYIFLGPPGSGKGTFAGIISEKTGLPHIDMGSTIRSAIKEGTDAGLRAQKYVEAGELVPGDIVIALAEERLNQDDAADGFILDGYPRSMEQAKALEKYLQAQDKGVRVLNLQLAVEVLIRRLTSRLICKECGAIFNSITMRPEHEGVCDDCGGELYVRADDNPDTIRKRFKTYQDETAPLINFYRDQEMLVDIDADGDIEFITDRILAAMTGQVT